MAESRIRVKGKADPEPIFTICLEPDALGSDNFNKLTEINDAMLAAYSRQDWDGADEAISKAKPFAAKLRLEGLYDVYQERVEGYRESPPPKDWDGVFVAQTK